MPDQPKNPDVSPDGEWIVFGSITDNQEDLFIVSRSGTRLRQLTNDVYKDRGPRWSPDAGRIAFLSDRSGRYECWSVNPDGSSLKQLSFTSGPRWAQAPVWSPDGTRLACNTQSGAPIVIDLGRSWAKQTPEVAAPDTIHSFTISRDNRTIYMAVSTSEADVWVASVR